MLKTKRRMKVRLGEYKDPRPAPSAIPVFILTILSVFIWVYFFRLKGGFLPMTGHPFGPVNITKNLLVAAAVSIPGFLFLHWALRGRPLKALFLWLSSAALILSPLLYLACSNVSDSVFSGFVIYGSVYWGKMGLWFMLGASIAMAVYHELGSKNFFLPFVCLAAISAYPVYSSVETVQVRYSHIFRGGVPANVERRYIFLLQAVRNEDVGYCDRYKENGDEGSWLGCTNIVRLLKGEPLLPSPYPTGKFAGFYPLTVYTDPETPSPDVRSRVDDGRTLIVDEWYYKRGSRRWIRHVAPDEGCGDFREEFLLAECEAFMTSDPSSCLTAECVIDIAVRNMESSYCDEIDARRHEGEDKKGPRKDYIGICYTAVELARRGVVR